MDPGYAGVLSVSHVLLLTSHSSTPSAGLSIGHTHSSDSFSSSSVLAQPGYGWFYLREPHSSAGPAISARPFTLHSRGPIQLHLTSSHTHQFSHVSGHWLCLCRVQSNVAHCLGEYIATMQCNVMQCKCVRVSVCA